MGLPLIPGHAIATNLSTAKSLFSPIPSVGVGGGQDVNLQVVKDPDHNDDGDYDTHQNIHHIIVS